MERQQARKKYFIPLTLKLAIAVVASLIAAFLLYEIMSGLEKMVAQKYYLSEEAEARNVNEAYRELKDYIEKENLKSTDTDKLQHWIKTHDNTYLMIFDNFTVSFDGGWAVDVTTVEDEDMLSDQSSVNIEENRPRITPDEFQQDLKNRILSFEDGDYYVFIEVYKEQHLYRIFNVLKLIMCVGVVVGTLLVYNARLMGRISKVSQYAENVTNGDLGATIKPLANDEIGRLATQVDTMRSSLIQRLINEKEAWDKNSELITAMSHDIRTPLTSLIGYLDIIESDKYQSEEDLKKYVAASRDKAFQLKDLSDKLFQYFLVFGSKSAEKDLEVYDAGILIQQLLSEHAAELINYGFNVEFDYKIPEGVEIEADVSGLKRLFDNLFSNIIKYADKSLPVEVLGDIQHDKIVVDVKNAIREDSRNVESNKIGLKTCDKICKDMGGDFAYIDQDTIFTVNVKLRAYHEKTVEEKVSEEGLAGISVHDIDLESLAETMTTPEVGEQETVDEEIDEVDELESAVMEEALETSIESAAPEPLRADAIPNDANDYASIVETSTPDERV
ncbi:MAG: HAMP domain-containing histidine kinase [Firmicutes bacterium]|nr:HAMP domain-containing histidine kinase [Bacillota bacterium]